MQQRKTPTPLVRNVPGATPRNTCPNCRALVQDGDIICVACGTNLLTGQKIAANEPAKPPANLKWLWITLAAIVGLAAVAALGAVAYTVLAQDPVQKAETLARANKDLEAINILTKHLERDPKDAAAFMLLGKIQWRLSQFAAAADSFEQAAIAEPTNTDGAMLALLGITSAAGQDMRDRQLAILKRVAEARPDDSQMWYLLGLARGNANDVAGEIEALKHAASAAPNDAAVQQQLGIALAAQGNYAEAERQLAAAAADAATKSDTAAARGFIADLDKQPDAAVSFLKEAVAGDTAVRDQAATRLGLLLVSQGQFDEADTYLASAASNKDNGVAQFFHGVCLQTKGLVPEATQMFQTVAQSSGPLSKEALVRVAGLYLEQNDLQKARESIEKAEAAGVNSAALCTVRGRYHAASNESARAHEWFQKAVQADPDYAGAYLENGLLYVREQSLNEGVKALERYVAIATERNEADRVGDVATLVDHLKQAMATEGVQRPAPLAPGRPGRNT